MTQPLKTVCILGAGFTRAFLPEAPLLIDDYNLQSLLPAYKHFDLAKSVLDRELEGSDKGMINIERLLTRLDGLPYDRSDASLQFSLLRLDVHSLFRRRLDRAKANGVAYRDELGKFATYCVNNNITCITFNYDDVLDEALWKVRPILRGSHGQHWHPDGGYGFFCRPSESCVIDTPTFKDKISPLLLKLHGSVNWRIRRGATRPYAVDSVVHHETWYPPRRREPVDLDSISLHLEPEELIVPPVLVKSALSKEPILSIVWGLAFRELSSADEVYFVGYSCPVTDLATTLLLRESLPREGAKVWIVNKAEEERDKKQVMDAYKNVFPTIKDRQFQFRGALEWIRGLVSESGSAREG